MVPPDGLSYTESGINLVLGKGYVNALGDFRGQLEPLYPIFIGLTNLLVRDPTVSGALVSMVFGSLLVWLVFRFCEVAYDTGTAYTASAIVMVYPYLANYASTALTEATYTFFIFLAVWWGWVAFYRGQAFDFAMCGIATALGYLTRFEIAGYLLCYLAFVLIVSRGRRWKKVLILTVIFVALVTPFHVYNWLQTGSPMLFGRFQKGLSYQVEILGLGQLDSPWSAFFGDSIRFAQRYTRGLGVAYTEYLPTLFPPLLIAITAAGLAEFLRRGAPGFTELYLCAVVAVTLFGYPLLRPSGRSLTVALPFLIALLAKGISQISQMVAGQLVVARRGPASTTAISVVITAIVCVSVLPQTYRPLLFGPDPLAPVELMEMGRWIRGRLPDRPMLLTNRRQVAFYAGTPSEVFSSYGYDEIVKAARMKGIRYVVLASHGGPSDIEWYLFEKEIRKSDELRLIHRITSGSKWVHLYEVNGITDPAKPSSREGGHAGG
ncbi:MAG: ArnT family glycosyltransferase [Dehalococcoidia bacterium]